VKLQGGIDVLAEKVKDYINEETGCDVPSSLLCCLKLTVVITV
jgi:hypothetical protein